jgi:hypothetical protein
MYHADDREERGHCYHSKYLRVRVRVRVLVHDVDQQMIVLKQMIVRMKIGSNEPNLPWKEQKEKVFVPSLI